MNRLSSPPNVDKADAADACMEAFDRLERAAVGGRPAWLLPWRKAGFARFAELGFPTTRHEDWRFTNLLPLTRLPFRPVLERPALNRAPRELESFPLARLPGLRLVFLDGHYAPELSAGPAPEAGFKPRTLADALRDDDGLIEHHLGRHPRSDANAITALNEAFFTDGAFLKLAAGQTVADPVQLVFVSTGAAAGDAAHPRNLIIAEPGSQLTVVESHVSLAPAPVVTNGVTEVVVGAGARVEHCQFQDVSPEAFHFTALGVQLGRDSNFISHSVALGGRLARHNIHTALDGEHLECVLNGLYLAGGDQLLDHHMVVEHAQPHGASHEYFNGILAGRAKGVFHGRILVRPHAQKTDAKQTNKNLLLSPEATINTKPQLEIYADDVKCTHGATIGQLNDEAIFYLRARGVGQERARRMLIHAFAGEIIERIRCAPLRAQLNEWIWNRLETHEQASLRP